MVNLRIEVRTLAVIFVGALFPFSSVLAGDIAAGKKAAAVCAACHGPEGVSGSPLWPNLAGQKKDYLIKQIQAFRKDERRDPLMSPMAKNIPEGDIDNLAEYFSSLK